MGAPLIRWTGCATEDVLRARARQPAAECPSRDPVSAALDWDYDRHPGGCCARAEGAVWTVCCHECAGTGVWPVPWIESPAEGTDDPTASCVTCKGSGRAIVALTGPPELPAER